MLKVLKQYEEDGMNIVEYTKDGKTASHTIRTPIDNGKTPVEPVETQPTLEQIAEETLLETKYQTALLEMLSMGDE